MDRDSSNSAGIHMASSRQLPWLLGTVEAPPKCTQENAWTEVYPGGAWTQNRTILGCTGSFYTASSVAWHSRSTAEVYPGECMD
jgi:hypothetical protein